MDERKELKIFPHLPPPTSTYNQSFSFSEEISIFAAQFL